VTSKKQGIDTSGVGLCENCEFMRCRRSDRGSTFYFCTLSESEPEFPKYPRLPVLECRGHKPQPDEPNRGNGH